MTSLIELLNWFDDKDKVLVSLSGGVDSALVAYAANKKLGKNAIAVTADYKTLSSEELDGLSYIERPTCFAIFLTFSFVNFTSNKGLRIPFLCNASIPGL